MKIILLSDETRRAALPGEFFRNRGYTPVVITRDSLISEKKLTITEEAVFWGEVSLLEDTAAVLILSQGYMWPQPVYKPSPEEWEKWYNDLDNYLRDERESASLWYSLLDILSENLPVCINPRPGREAAVFLPESFTRLTDSDFRLLPHCLGNDYTSLDAFMREGAKNYFTIPLHGDDGAGAFTLAGLAEAEKQNRPLFIQASDSAAELTICTAGSQAVVTGLGDSAGKESEIPRALDSLPGVPLESAARLGEFLQIPLGVWRFRLWDGIWALSSFSSVVAWESLDPVSAETLLKGLVLLCREAGK